MARLILLIILILFVIWLIRPYMKKKERYKNKNQLDSILNSDKTRFKKPNTTVIILTAIILIVSVVWLLPKLGINFLALLQKAIPLIYSLRSILPF